MNAVVCNYSILRFRPYRETGEFVNVGVVLQCPQFGYLGYLVERRKHKRITDFFPELDLDIYKTGLDGLIKELNRLNTGEVHNGQLFFGEEARVRNAIFKELVRPRESLFNYSDIATVLATNPEAKLQELFNFHIERQFAQEREYQETIMRHELNGFLQKFDLARFYRLNQQIGDDSYKISLPFVHYEDEAPKKAIKPLHLDKPDPTDIYRHGDSWISSVCRLRKKNQLPKSFLFTVKYPPKEGQSLVAAREICASLQEYDTQTVSFSDCDAIQAFARC